MSGRILSRSLFLSILIGLVLLPGLSYGLYRGENADYSALPKPTRIIVKYNPQMNKSVQWQKASGSLVCGIAAVDELHARYQINEQVQLLRQFTETAMKSEELAAIYVLAVPEGVTAEDMAGAYEALAEVVYAEPDYIMEIFEAPNDILSSHQWYLHNDGQAYLGVNRIPGDFNDTQILKIGTMDADIDAFEAFDSTGTTTRPLVGIIDTGVDSDHPDLEANIWVNAGEDLNGNGQIEAEEINGKDDDHNGFVDDFHGWDFSGDEYTLLFTGAGENDPDDNDTLLGVGGHGTHCAGIAGAVRNNSIGVAGLASPCRIMAIKVFPNAFSSVCAQGIIYAADMGCDVINMSWGGPWRSEVISDALIYARDKGVIPISAAGNSGGNHYFYPAALPHVFTVGATNILDEVTTFSTYGDHIEVVAPGEDILSLRSNMTDIYATGGSSGREPDVHIVDDYYYLMDGTSMASPCVVGVAAHLLAASPGTAPERIMEILILSADDIIYPYGGDTLESPGKDIYSGYGRINLNAALQMLSGRMADIDYPYQNAIVIDEVPIIGTAAGDDFTEYVLEYGVGHSPDEWIEISGSTTPVIDDTLGVWNCTGLTGLYSLRLTVGADNQTVVEVIAAGDIRVEITSPAEGDTIEGIIELIGFTIIPDFSHYSLEYGSGAAPSSWTPLKTETRMVADNVLGKIVLSSMQQGLYTFRVSMESQTGAVYTDQITVTIKGIVKSAWFRNLKNHGSLSPAIGDIDGDGQDEIVIGMGATPGANFAAGGVTVLDHYGQIEPGWPRDTLENMMSPPAVADLDRDGIDDIIICSEQSGLRTYLSGSPDWNSPIKSKWNFRSLAAPVIVDLENDGDLEVMVMIDSGYVYGWRSNGDPIGADASGLFDTTSWGGGAFGWPSISVADLDQNGQNEIIVASADYSHPFWTTYGLGVWDTDGNNIWNTSDDSDSFWAISGFAIADIDDEDDLEIILCGQTFENIAVFVYKSDGSYVDGFPIIIEDLEAQWWFTNHPAIGDLDGDGTMEIVISVWNTAEARVYAWHRDGTPLGALDNDGTAGNDPFLASAGQSMGSPVLADLNGNGMADILVQIGSFTVPQYQRIVAWDYQGDLIPGFPLYASDNKLTSTIHEYCPLVSDLDKNGLMEISLCYIDLDSSTYSRGSTASADAGVIRVLHWELEQDYDSSAVPWPKLRHDNYNSGIFGGPILPTDAEDDLDIPKPLIYSLEANYPNPFNAKTAIEYNLPRRSHVTFTVFNILGQQVRVLLDENQPAGQKQVVWDGKDDAGKTVASGVYFYKLETEDFSDTRKMLLLK